MEKIKDVLGRNIVRYRKSAGLSQIELADQLGLAKTTISRWESGFPGESIEVLETMANLFGVTVMDLFVTDETSSWADEYHRRKKRQNTELYIKVDLEDPEMQEMVARMLKK